MLFEANWFDYRFFFLRLIGRFSYKADKLFDLFERLCFWKRYGVLSVACTLGEI